MEKVLREMKNSKSIDIENYCRSVMRLYTKERLEYLYSNDIKIFDSINTVEENIFEQAVNGIIKSIAFELLYN